MILAIADDLTGALEVAAQFARFGSRACVTTEREFAMAPETDVLVIDTETRHLAADEAAGIVREVLAATLRFNPWLIYKKTDSTLRGNIPAEFRALLAAFPERRLVYVPAYPEMGRTVRGGVLLVDGVEVHRTAFAGDPLNPVLRSNIAEMLGDIPVLVCDGETIEDVARAAREILASDPTPLAAGPGSLAGALAAVFAGGRHEDGVLPRLSRCLVVNGSMHPVSVEQIARARLRNDWILAEQSSGGSGMERAIDTGEHVGKLLGSGTFDGLVVFGGDTAFGIHRALGSPRFESCGEVIPGVPISRCGDMYWVTKAGGFGTPDLLNELRKRLT